MSLLSFIDTHLKVDGVAYDVHLCGLQVIEEVTVVPVVVAHGILIFAKSFVQKFLVIYVTLLHTEHTAQIVGGKHCVTDPCDVTDKVFLSFVYFQIDVYMLRVVVPYAVFKYFSITETEFVVFVEQCLLTFFISVGGKLGRLHEACHGSCLTYLSESAFREETSLYLLGLQLLVSLNNDVAHLYLLLLVHIHVQYYVVLVGEIIHLCDSHFRIVESLVVEIVSCKSLCTVYHVRSNLTTFQQSELRLEVFSLRLLHSRIVYHRHTRSCSKIEMEINLVADERVGSHGNL